MIQEEKQLLLKDLCARLPYGVIVLDEPAEHRGKLWSVSREYTIYYESDISEELECQSIFNVRCYLRPMSSMTKEEREEVQVFICDEWFFEDSGFATKVRKEGYIEFLANYDCSGIDPEFCGEYIDWLITHHFDYRGLIEKGLALEAPEGMYKIE